MQTSTPPRPRRGQGALAAGASLLPGLGHFLAGAPARAAGFFALFVLCLGSVAWCISTPHCVPGAPLMAAATLLVILLAMASAYRTAHRTGALAHAGHRFASVALLAAIAVGAWALIEAWARGRLVWDAMQVRYATAVLSISALAWLLSLFFQMGSAPVSDDPHEPAAARRSPARGSSPLVRYILALAVPLILIWPLDKFGEHAWKYLLRNTIAPVTVVGDSMAPSTPAGDRVLAHRKAPIKRFDAVAFNVPGENGDWPMVKRIVGMPGEEVQIVDDELFINGAPAALPEAIGPLKTSRKLDRPANAAGGRSILLKDDEYFVIGDHTGESHDSRYWAPFVKGHQAGALPRSRIIGVVTWRYWPAGTWKK